MPNYDDTSAPDTPAAVVDLEATYTDSVGSGMTALQVKTGIRLPLKS